MPRYVALQNHSMIFGQYESHVVRGLLAVPGAMDVAYDVGAHVGYMTLVLAKRVHSGGKVFAFEPEPNNINVMHQLISQNGLQHIVRVIPIALAGANGEQNLIKRKSASMYLLGSSCVTRRPAHLERLLTKNSHRNSWTEKRQGRVGAH